MSNDLTMGDSNSTQTSDVIVGENVRDHPFLEFQGLTNGSWFVFFVIAVASSKLARVFPSFGLPLITGYMIIGCLCGPYVLNMVTKDQVPDLAYITQIALSFIAFSAGSELYLPELRSLFKTILLITGLNALITYVVMTLFIYLLASTGIIGWMGIYPGPCVFTISMIAASIMVARSPASAIAVVRELRAKGPVTSTMLGVTVVGDVVVLVLFTLSTSITLAVCSGGGFEGGAFLITILTLFIAVGLGYALGGLLIFLLWLKYAKYAILPLGFLTFIVCDWFAVWSIEHLGVSLNFDALLICITAGYVVTNQSKNRSAFLQLLGRAATYIFIPFFTKVGVELNIPVFVASIGFAFLVFLARALCIFVGSFLGARLSGLDSFKQRTLWMTMLAQAGVSLGLASEVRVKFPDWGGNFQTSVIAVVLINQFVGPVLCKKALKMHGEAGKMVEGEEEHEHGDGPKKIKRGLIIGIDTTSLAVAQRLLNLGWAVTMLDTNRENLDLKRKLVVALPDLTGNLKTMPAEGAEHVASKAKYPLEPQADSQTQPEGEADGISLSSSSSSASSSHSESADETNDSTSSPTIAVSNQFEPRLIVKQIPLPGESLTRSMGAIVDSLLHESSLSIIDAVVVQMDSDEDTYDVCAYMLDHRHFHNVIGRLHNPAWSTSFAEHGIIPHFGLSTSSHILFKGMTSKAPVFCSDVLSMPDAFKSFMMDPSDEDFNFFLLDLSADYRDTYAARHQAPTTAVRQRLKDMTDIKLRTVAASQRDNYIEKLLETHNHEFKHDDNETSHEESMMLGPSGQMKKEEDSKDQAKKDKAVKDSQNDNASS